MKKNWKIISIIAIIATVVLFFTVKHYYDKAAKQQVTASAITKKTKQKDSEMKTTSLAQPTTDSENENPGFFDGFTWQWALFIGVLILPMFQIPTLYKMSQGRKRKSSATMEIVSTVPVVPATATSATPSAVEPTEELSHWFVKSIEWFFEKFRKPILVGIAILCLYLGFKGLTWLHAPALEAKKTWLGDKEYELYNPFKGDGKMTEKERGEYNLKVAQENRKTSNWYNFWHGVPEDENYSQKNNPTPTPQKGTNVTPYFQYEKPTLREGDVYIDGNLQTRGKTVEFSDQVVSAGISKPIEPSRKPNSAPDGYVHVIRN